MNSAKIFNPSLYLLMGKGQVPLATGGRARLGAQEPGKDRQTDHLVPFFPENVMLSQRGNQVGPSSQSRKKHPFSWAA